MQSGQESLSRRWTDHLAHLLYIQFSPRSTHTTQSDPPREILPEILGEIFGWVVYFGPLDKRDRDQVVRLMLVCRLWHDIVRQTHHLWSRVRVSLATSRHNEHIVAWLSKAGTRRRTLALTNYNYHKFCTCGKPRAGSSSCCLQKPGLVALLTEGGVPLDYLILPSSSPKNFGSFTRALTGSAVQPESLLWNSIKGLTILLSEWGFYEEQMMTLGPLFKSLPAALTSLDLTFTSRYKFQYEIPTPTLRRLKSFKISCNWAVTRITDILQHCSSVEHLCVATGHYSTTPLINHPLLDLGDHATADLSDMEREELPNLSPIVLTRLRSLFLDINPSDSAYILRRLQTSSGNALKIQIRNDAVRDALDALDIPTPGPGKPTIDSLTISGAHSYNTGASPDKIATITMIDILANLPFLSHLALDKVTFDAKELLTALRGPCRHVKAAPRLRTIELIDPDDDFDLEALLTYVMLRSSKFRGTDALRRIELRFSANQCPRISQVYRDSSIVQDLQSLGVVVDIYTRTYPVSH